LKTWNGLNSNFLISGQRLVVTDRKKDIINTSKKVKSMEISQLKGSETNGQFTNYTVEYGDTLFKISRKFGNIPISELRILNGLDNVNYLKPGTKIKIKKRTSDMQI